MPEYVDTNQENFRCSFPQSMIARLVLNLLKSRDTIALLQWSIAFDAFPF